MSVSIVIAFAIGVIVGGISCALLAQRTWRRVGRETTEQMKRSINVQDQFYATTAMCYLSALQKLEAGEVQEARRELASGSANFYHHFDGRGELSRWIEAQKRKIELYAKKSEVLRAALARKPDDKVADPAD